MTTPQIIPFSSIVESNGKTIRENNMRIQHSLLVGQRVSAHIDDYEQTVSMYVIEVNRDCDGTPLYSLTISKRVKEMYPEWINNLKDDPEDQVSRWYIGSSPIARGYMRAALTVQEPFDPKSAISNKWQFHHSVTGSTIHVEFDAEVNQKQAELLIYARQCPEHQVTPGSIYPITD